MNRLDIIKSLIAQKNLKNYLEIGVENGHNFFRVKSSFKVAVDPAFAFDTARRLGKTLVNPSNLNNHYFEKTSDDFFAQNSRKCVPISFRISSEGVFLLMRGAVGRGPLSPATPIPLPESFLMAKIPKITAAIPSGMLRNHRSPAKKARIPAINEITPSTDELLAAGAGCGDTGAAAGAG